MAEDILERVLPESSLSVLLRVMGTASISGNVLRIFIMIDISSDVTVSEYICLPFHVNSNLELEKRWLDTKEWHGTASNDYFR